jgi:8-oxo-dGTP pyrophosphatase MutT (NUDIX family)
MANSDLQAGALCFRQSEKKGLEILLITSRDTGRWVIPKGWPENGELPRRAAVREALEEAGVSGDVSGGPLGSFQYDKVETSSSRKLEVMVFAVRVTKQRRQWAEGKERERKWFATQKAVAKVDEPELATLIKTLAKRFARGKKPCKN